MPRWGQFVCARVCTILTCAAYERAVAVEALSFSADLVRLWFTPCISFGTSFARSLAE